MPPRTGDDDTVEQIALREFGKSVIAECQKLLANPDFRKMATPDEIREIEAALAEAMQAEFHSRSWAIPGHHTKIAIATVNPASAGAALGMLALGLAAVGSSMKNAPDSVKRDRDEAIQKMPKAARIRYLRDLALADFQGKANWLHEVVLSVIKRSKTRLTKALVKQLVQGQAMAKAAGTVATAKASQALAAQLTHLRQAAAAALAGTVLTVGLQDFRDAITKAVAEVKELIRGIPPPPPGSECEEAINKFKEASKAAADALNNWRKSDELSQMKFYKAYRAFVDAYDAVIQCLAP